MKVQPQLKSARFASVVEDAGAPEPYTPWREPRKDREFQKALREERVMTVLQEPASNKADVALVGYLKKEHALYMVFPKSLEKFKDRRIVGLNYDLLAEPGVKVSKKKR
jgi:hypothetical protein